MLIGVGACVCVCVCMCVCVCVANEAIVTLLSGWFQATHKTEKPMGLCTAQCEMLLVLCENRHEWYFHGVVVTSKVVQYPIMLLCITNLTN